MCLTFFGSKISYRGSAVKCGPSRIFLGNFSNLDLGILSEWVNRNYDKVILYKTNHVRQEISLAKVNLRKKEIQYR